MLSMNMVTLVFCFVLVYYKCGRKHLKISQDLSNLIMDDFVRIRKEQRHQNSNKIHDKKKNFF